MPVTSALHPPRTVHRPKYWTWEDLQQFGERMTPRLEIIDGVLYADGLPVWEDNPDFDVAPAPNPIYHQRTVRSLAYALETWLREHAVGELFFAPVDVRLPGARIVEPDVFVIAADDMARYLATGEPPGLIDAVPIFIVEVLSPRTAHYYRYEKKHLYEEAGVPEYLIVDPRAQTVEQYVLDGGRYGEPAVADEGLRILSAVLDADGEPFGFDVAELFRA